MQPAPVFFRIKEWTVSITTMRPTALHIALALTAVLAAPPVHAGTGSQSEEGIREIGRTTEKEIKVILNSSFGTVIVSKGEGEKIFVMESTPDRQSEGRMEVQYSVRNRIGYLEITLGEHGKDGESGKKSFHIENFDRGKWYLRFSDAIPISFDVELGVGRGDFNLTGLEVKDFNLSTGASDVSLAFDSPNSQQIENLNIESGVSKFDARNLNNANFKHFSFQGGVGSYTLDFGGVLKNEVDVDIEVGLGLVTLVVPQNIGARVMYEESWASKLDCDRDFRSDGENTYVSGNYHDVSGKMNINIDSGLGSIKVRRR
jgi:hypothetical protein